MASARCRELEAAKVGLVLGGDLGCLLNIAGRLKRRGLNLEVRHLTEVLAGIDQTTPAIGEDADNTEQ